MALPEEFLAGNKGTRKLNVRRQFVHQAPSVGSLTRLFYGRPQGAPNPAL